MDESQLKNEAKKRGWQIREGTSVPDFCSDDGYRHPFHVTAPSEDLVELINSNPPFTPHWPKNLKLGDLFEVACDDKGRNGKSWLKVFIANDGDVHLMMQDWEEYPDFEPTPLPSLRCRNYFGGGRNHRTHQVLLWLAEAMRLDAEERNNR